MAQQERFTVDPAQTPEAISAIVEIAASRNVSFDAELEDPTVWVVAATDTLTGEIIGGAAVQIPVSPRESEPAPLILDVVRKDKLGEGVGKLMIKRIVGVVDNLSGRTVVAPRSEVERSLGDFDPAKLEWAGDLVLIAS